jgi:hypothetical protein
MIGGRERRMLTFAAREAQILSVLPAAGEGGTSLAGFQRQLGWIAEARGARNDLMVGLRIPFGELAGLGESRRAAAERFAARTGMSPEDALGSPFALVGDLPSVADHLREIGERFGVSYVTVSEELAWQIAPVVAELGA